MKRLFYILFCFACVFVCTNSVGAAYNYYDEDADVLIITHEKLQYYTINSSNESSVKITTDDGKGSVTHETITLKSDSKYEPFKLSFYIRTIGTILVALLGILIYKKEKAN